jgi:uncharacterized repeat protein (TIGR04138 family)
MTEQGMVERIRNVVEKDPRFPPEAYRFLFEALDFTVKRFGVRRHISGVELLEGIRDYSLHQFGGMTRTVFKLWGIEKTVDFGDMVFNMVDEGLMGKTDTDTRDDFERIYDFDDAFPLLFTANQSLSD